jgi:hypothetical protein
VSRGQHDSRDEARGACGGVHESAFAYVGLGIPDLLRWPDSATHKLRSDAQTLFPADLALLAMKSSRIVDHGLNRRRRPVAPNFVERSAGARLIVKSFEAGKFEVTPAFHHQRYNNLALRRTILQNYRTLREDLR